MTRPCLPLLLLGLLPACSAPDRAPDQIHLTHVATIGGEAEELMSMPLVSPRLANGRFMATMDNVESPPRMYDHSGKVLFTIGQAGSGPGEFRSPSVTVVSADSVIVFDRRLSRATVLLADSVVRTFPLPSMVAGAIELPDGSLAISVLGWRNDIPFQHLSREGELLGTFGMDGTLNVMSLAPDSTLWTATTYNRCVVSHWSANLKLLSSREYCGGWFEPYEEFRPVTPDAPPASMVIGVWAESDRLWVVGRMADSGWMAGLGEEKSYNGQAVYPDMDIEKVYDLMIDVYDLSTGSRIAQRREDWGMVMVSEPGVVVRHWRTEDGWPAAELYEVDMGQANGSNFD